MALRQQLAVTGRGFREPYVAAINAAKGDLWGRYANRENTRLQQESIDNANKWAGKNYQLGLQRFGLAEDEAERQKKLGLINTGIAAGGLGLNAYLGLKGANETADMVKSMAPAVTANQEMFDVPDAVSGVYDAVKKPVENVASSTLGLVPQIGGAIVDLGKDAAYGIGEIGGAIDKGLRKVPGVGDLYEGAANAIMSLGNVIGL